jgi:RNA polymerase sigma-70 factor (ECF subfamily)
VRGLRSFDGRSSFATWAYRVATNACFDELRRRRRRPSPVADLDGPERPGQSGRLAAERAGRDEGVTGAEIDHAGARLDIDAALARLPEEFRVAVVLRDLCDLSYAEIAEALEVPVGTVRSRIARGRAALAPLLGDPGPERPGQSGGPGPERPGQSGERGNPVVPGERPTLER